MNMTSIMDFPTAERKAWYYIAPVLFLTTFISIPKFFEMTLNYDKTRNGYFGEIPSTIRPRDIMGDEDYIKYYTYVTFSATIVIPVIFLLYLNIRIIHCLITSSRAAR